jgi:hypothetical protein
MNIILIITFIINWVFVLSFNELDNLNEIINELKDYKIIIERINKLEDFEIIVERINKL